jgi:hypothetical protein
MEQYESNHMAVCVCGTKRNRACIRRGNQCRNCLKLKKERGEMKIVCRKCGKKKHHIANGLCKKCYESPIIKCKKCGQMKLHLSKGCCKTCYQLYVRPRITCTRCLRQNQINGGEGYCRRCRKQLNCSIIDRKESRRVGVCVECKMERTVHAKNMCKICYQKVAKPRRTCNSCGEFRPINGRNLCLKCYNKYRPKKHCQKCGELKLINGRGMCLRCYREYGPKKNCLECGELKFINGGGLCSRCYMRANYQKQKETMEND